MKLRNEIDDKYKWNIDLFHTDDEIESAFADCKFLIDTLPKYNGKFEDKEMFFEYMTAYKKQFSNIYKLLYYIQHSLSEDNSNVKILKLQQRADIMISKLNKVTSFAEPQMSKLDTDYLKELLNDPRAKDLSNMINEIIRNKPHELNEETAHILNMVNNSFSDSETIFEILTNSEMEYEDAIDSLGEYHQVDNSSYPTLVSSTDRKLRETAYFSYMKSYGKLNKTLAEIFIKDLKFHNDDVILHKHKDLLSMQLFDDQIPTEVFHKNMQNVINQIPLMQDIIKSIAKYCSVDNFNYYDLFEDKKISGDISIEEAQKIMLSALSILGDDYISKVNYKLTDKSIDYMPNKNKQTGAYCSDLYGAKSLILMNWKNDYNSLSTLCHEMGHCINAEYYNSTQPEEKTGCTVFAGEIASTVNEILLTVYMLKTSNSTEQKYYLNNFLKNVIAAIFKQTLYSEFELFAHSSIEKDDPISYEDLNEFYHNLHNKYYDDSCIIPECVKYGWSMIPHFYSPYYVYSYSTGLISAINIVNNILEDSNYTAKYISFLKNGTEKPAFDILKEIDIDLTTDLPYQKAFDFIKKQLDIYNSIK